MYRTHGKRQRPIFKKGNRDDIGNYRPVSLTNICGKIMEKIARKEIVDQLERNEIISDVQHGFVQGKSQVSSSSTPNSPFLG